MCGFGKEIVHETVTLRKAEAAPKAVKDSEKTPSTEVYNFNPLNLHPSEIASMSNRHYLGGIVDFEEYITDRRQMMSLSDSMPVLGMDPKMLAVLGKLRDPA